MFRMTLRLALLAAALCCAAPAGALSAIADMDTISTRHKAEIDSLQSRLEKNSVGKALSGALFSAKQGDPGTGTIDSESPYLPFTGRYIRNITIERYNILSDTRTGSKNPEMPAVVRAVEAVHIDTRKNKIASFLLFGRGDALDPHALADSERLLRETSFIQDARILVDPVEGSPDSVDVRVLTRDIWSIGVRYSWITKDRHRVKFYERNLLGYGQTLEYEVSLDLSRERRADHTVFYGANNIYGTFIDGSVRWVDAVAYRQNTWALSRGYISPEIKWIGGATVEGMDDLDPEPSKIRKWDRQDFWIGRSLRLARGFGGEDMRSRFIPAVRITRTDYHVRPPVGPDLNRGRHDRVTYLGGLSLTGRSFRKTRMVFSFGRTEDIPYGYLATVTGGVSSSEFFDRPYWAFDFAYADFIGESGYLAFRGGVGGYQRDGAFEDGTLTLTFGGFSGLRPFYHSAARHFFLIDYICGYNRLYNDTVALEQPRGDLRGLSNTGVEGFERLTFGWEGILFADFDWWGFRFASFGYAEAGQCGPDWYSFLKTKYFFSLGGGFRVHNERLIFDAYEIRFMYHPVIPEGADTQWFRFEAVRHLRIPFLSPGAPRVLKYD